MGELTSASHVVELTLAGRGGAAGADGPRETPLAAIHAGFFTVLSLSVLLETRVE